VSVLVLVGLVLAGPGDELAALRRTLGIGQGPLGTPADVPEGGVHAFLQVQPGDSGEPVTWDPCREIRYEVNPEDAPGDDDEVVAFVEEAVDEISRVTGLQFELLGTTDRRPSWESRFVPAGRREPVLVAWADEEEVEQLAGDVAGVGGAVALSYRSGARFRYVTGQVTLDEDVYDDLARSASGEGHQRAILLHELGHLVGLDHVDSADELMYADNVGRLEFGTGDLNGLVRLGQGPCT
jgi:hypothetical protein